MDRYPNIFFGGNTGSTSTAPASPASNLATERNQQVSELLAAFPSCRPLSTDRSMMELPLTMPDGKTVGMLVALPPTFPKDRPIITVSQPIIHPWVGYGGQLTFPALTSWRYPGSGLKAVVEDACGGLGGQAAAGTGGTAAGPGSAATGSGRPGAASGPQGQSSLDPRPNGGAGSSTGAGPLRAGAQRAAAGGEPAGAAGQGPGSSSAAEPIPDSFPEMQSMPSQHLATALHDEAAFEALLAQVLANGQSAQARAALKASTIDIAQRNLQKEAALNDIRNQVAVIRSADYAGAADEFRQRRAKIEDLVSRITPASLMTKLQEAAQQAELESERLVKEFMGGAMPVEEFVGGYGDLRALYHKRDLKRKAAMQSSVL